MQVCGDQIQFWQQGQRVNQAKEDIIYYYKA